MCRDWAIRCSTTTSTWSRPGPTEHADGPAFDLKVFFSLVAKPPEEVTD